jgi:hypothetical protein
VDQRPVKKKDVPSVLGPSEIQGERWECNLKTFSPVYRPSQDHGKGIFAFRMATTNFFDRLTADNPCFLASIKRDYGKGGEQSPPLCAYMVFVQGNMPELLRGAPVFSVL